MAVWPHIHRLRGHRYTNWQHHVNRAACEADLNELGTPPWISAAASMCRQAPAISMNNVSWSSSPYRVTNARKDTRLPRGVCVDGLLSIAVPRLYINIITTRRDGSTQAGVCFPRTTRSRGPAPAQSPHKQTRPDRICRRRTPWKSRQSFTKWRPFVIKRSLIFLHSPLAQCYSPKSVHIIL